MDGAAEPKPARARGRRMAVRSKVMLGIAVVAVAGIAGLLTLATGPGAGADKVKSLPPAHNFTAPAFGHPGQQVSLAALAGKPVIINFFASWCGPCKRETPLLANFYKSHHGQVLIIGVDSNDTSAKATSFISVDKVTYPVAVDPFPASVAVSYGVVALPQTFFLNAQHKIVRHIYGDLTLAELTSWANSLAPPSSG